jgi:hypothetical protein
VVVVPGAAVAVVVSVAEAHPAHGEIVTLVKTYFYAAVVLALVVSCGRA